MNCPLLLISPIRLLAIFITFSPRDPFVPLQAQKQEQNHISVPKILKAVELNTLINCLLYFLTSTLHQSQSRQQADHEHQYADTTWGDAAPHISKYRHWNGEWCWNSSPSEAGSALQL